ncbi:Phosphoglycerate mutase family protein [Enhygromyxa salina]|uniref:Phosphoglycerate mutase family protein n=1 Tax=Enhygromyxa salina TaxID=215803 RepID=A0A0C2D7S5_9BACT|nr:histidine phosphatase family protein [Enhygromyxa salina]KIG16067.1 Phosphoglycerate mutase family protein [Enhygromyxa salina]
MSTVHVIRHAQASMFAADYDQLSARGCEQARTLGVVLTQRFAAADRPGFDAVYSGPARRHEHTASLARESFASAELGFPEPIVLAGFDEHDGQALVEAALPQLSQDQPGAAKLATQAMDTTLEPRQRAKAWQLLFEAIMRRWLRGELELEGVESWPSFHQRVREAFGTVRANAKGEVALFTSVGPTAVVLHEVLGLPPERAFEQAWRLYNTAITRVVYSGDRMTLDGFNEVAHLPLRDWTHR